MIFLFLFFPIIYSQQLLKLNSFPFNQTTQLNVTGPFSVYLSASSDYDIHLKNLFITSYGSERVSLYQLKMNKMNPSSGFLQPHRVNGKKLSLTSNLSFDQTIRLQGFLYITTYRQMNDNAFYVYDIDQSETITIDERRPENCTLVFINSNCSSEPLKSSVISNWVQTNRSSAQIYLGVPRNSREKSHSFIFSNPVSTTQQNPIFIENVETFSLITEAFYIKVQGGLQFKIAPGYYEINGTTVTSAITTGFYMKPNGKQDVNVTVNMLAINSIVETSNTMTGANAIGKMSKSSSISVMEKSMKGSSNGYSVTPVDQILGWSTPYIGNSIEITSKNAEEGEFFVQYYVIHG